MAIKSKTIYVCSSCGFEAAKWYGQCPGCGEWNSLTEKMKISGNSQNKSNITIESAYKLSEISHIKEHRYYTGISELDRVLGGGLVKGSIALISGDPGIGKSTILLQACENFGRQLSILYVSGEESPHQLKLRADRLKVSTGNLKIFCETDTERLCEYIKTEKPGLVIIDSIQTMSISEISSSAGSITQVRESASLLMRTAKYEDIPIIMVGHVNKDGNIAGPKVLEHIVDTVLYFEGERNLSYRILRAVKNRYGSTNEIGVFEMGENGLAEVPNPSLMLISGRPKNVPGSCVVCAMEGSRPILAEAQGLVTQTGFGTPRRMATGFDYNRLSMLIAVLEKRAGYFLGNMDCYVNIVGGLKIDEPAADLSVALALISSLKDAVIREDAIAFGEIGLAGEIRAVSTCEQRISEVLRLGFKRCVIPQNNMKNISNNAKNSLDIIGIKTIRDAFDAVSI
ncbi:MAG: DNA repair protein RadA [Oscillospiraceae bacterium]|nr:DNA repair protein RadA [Oscillospiraceae bacterium]